MCSPGASERTFHDMRSRVSRFFVWAALVAMGATGLGLLLMPAVGSSQVAVERSACRANLQALWEELNCFLQEHGELPVDVDGRFSIDAASLTQTLCTCPACKRSYLSNPHATAADVQARTASIPLVFDPPRSHVRRSPLDRIAWERSFVVLILYADGHVETRVFDSVAAYKQFLAVWAIPLD